MSAALRLVRDVQPEAPELEAPPRPQCGWRGGCAEVLPEGEDPGFGGEQGAWAWIDSELLCPAHATVAAGRRAKAARERKLLRAGVPRRFLEVDVAALDVTGHGEQELASRLAAWSPGDAFPVISGGPGTGKTTWATLFVRVAVEAGQDALLLDESTLKEALHREMGSAARRSIVDDLVDADVVVLDDLGGLRRPSDWYWDKVEYVVYQRWARELPLLVTLPTSSTGSGLQRIAEHAGERLASLLFGLVGGREVRLAGGNRRFAVEEVRRG